MCGAAFLLLEKTTPIPKPVKTQERQHQHRHESARKVLESVRAPARPGPLDRLGKS